MQKSITMFLVASILAACGSNFKERSNDVLSGDSLDRSNQVKVDSADSVQSWMEVKEVPRRIHIRMPYADTSNFTHKRLYECAKCILRPSIAKSLINASEAAGRLNLSIVLLDCYRPYSVQVEMYKLIHDERYVAKPGKGSNHNKGCAGDFTLADSAGNVLDMGSEFDDFSKKAHFDYEKLNLKQKQNRVLLRNIMTDSGFDPYEHEWWHFNFKDLNYPVSDQPLPCN